MNRPARETLFDESGLSRFVLPLGDRHFLLAIAAALPVWAVLGLGLAGPIRVPVGAAGWLAFALWQPLIEELVFRGVLQGQLLRILGDRRFGGITPHSLRAECYHLIGARADE